MGHKKHFKFVGNKIIVDDFWLWLLVVTHNNKPISYRFDEDKVFTIAEFPRNAKVMSAINSYKAFNVRNDLRQRMSGGSSKRKIHNKVLEITGYQL